MTADTIAAVPAPLPFRLRTALGVLLVGIFGVVAVPRARAAYRLQGIVNKYADYGLCMAGPTGSVVIQEDPAQFRALVRRRLISAGADEKPFARCGKLASDLSGRTFAELAYQATAGSFFEWGAGASAHNLSELYGELPNLEAIAAQAYPFSRKPLRELVRPSLGAKEAVHPSELPSPGKVHGLRTGGAVIRSAVDTTRGRILMLSTGQEPWAVRSRDLGRTWTPTSAWQAAVDGHANRCVSRVGGASFAIASRDSGGRPAILLEEGLMGQSSRRELGKVGDHVAVLGCDESGAVVLTQGKSPGSARVMACPLASAGCREIELPELAKRTDAVLDVARVARTVVIAVAKDGLVRVTTSRDEGVTMTPLSLVFDAREVGHALAPANTVPTLVPMGKRLMLQLTAPNAASAAESDVLISDDFGASFRTF